MNTFGTASTQLNPHLRAAGSAPGLPQIRSQRGVSALLSAVFPSHHGGAQRPGCNVSEQALPQLILVLELRTRQEDLLQTEAQPLPGLPEEERGDHQRPVRHQRAPDRGGVDAGHREPRTQCQGRALALFCHRPHHRPALLDVVVHPGAAQRERRAD